MRDKDVMELPCSKDDMVMLIGFAIVGHREHCTDDCPLCEVITDMAMWAISVINDKPERFGQPSRN